MKVERFGRCDNPRCVLEHHEVVKGLVWHQDAHGRAWVEVRAKP